MNKTKIEDCRRMLEAKRAELLSSHRITEGITIERVPDSTEEFSLEAQRSVAVDAVDRRTTLLRQVTEALERIAGGNMECVWRVRTQSPQIVWPPCPGRLFVLNANKQRRTGYPPTQYQARVCGWGTA